MTIAPRIPWLTLLALAAPLAQAESRPAPPRGAIVVAHPWIAAPPNGAPTAAGYAVIRNRGRQPDALIGAKTPDAAALELHSMSMTGGIMRMRPIQGPLAIAPGGALTLAPGGDHFMLVRPSRPLIPGARVPVTLIFAKAGVVRAVFTVRSTADAGPMDAP